MRMLLSAWCVAFLACVAQSGWAQDFGRFEPDQPSTRWLDGDVNMELLDDFSYIDPHGHRYLAPKHSMVDGASIPWQFWSIIGSPLRGKYRRASVVHDVYCANDNSKKTHSPEEVHLMFYNACRCGGVSKAKAKMMYWAVYWFGPWWNVETVQVSLPDGMMMNLVTVRDVPSRAAQQNQPVSMQRGEQAHNLPKKLEKYFQDHDPSLEEIKDLPPSEVIPDSDDRHSE